MTSTSPELRGPRFSGRHVTADVDDQLAPIPAIACTAHVMRYQMASYLAAGFDEVKLNTVVLRGENDDEVMRGTADHVAENHPGVTLDEVRTDCTAILIPDFDDPAEAEQFIASIADELFAHGPRRRRDPQLRIRPLRAAPLEHPLDDAAHLPLRG